MKKILPVLVLTSLLAIFLLPTTILAAACPNSCNVASVECDCGDNYVTASDPKYCWQGQRFVLNAGGKESCENVASGNNDNSGGGLQYMPETSIDTDVELLGLIDKIGGWIFSALLSVAAIFLVVAGFVYVTAAGNPAKTATARTMLINALIGLAIALGARGLMAIIKNLVA